MPRENAKIVRQYCQHLVCVFVQYKHLTGQHAGRFDIELASGFVVEFRGFWLLITAGHYFKDLDRQVQNCVIKIERSFFVDYLGINAKLKIPVIFDYDQLIRASIDNDCAGLDICIVTLGEYLTEHFKRSGVVPFTEEKWLYDPDIDGQFEGYRLLGLAREYASLAPNTSLDAGFPSLTVQPAVLGINRLEPQEIPNAPKSEWPWFIGNVPSGQGIDDIVGMSGGPILGFRMKGNEMYYRIVAIQSRWREESRTIFACPFPILMTLLGSLLEKHAAARELTFPE